MSLIQMNLLSLSFIVAIMTGAAVLQFEQLSAKIISVIIMGISSSVAVNIIDNAIKER